MYRYLFKKVSYLFEIHCEVAIEGCSIERIVRIHWFSDDGDDYALSNVSYNGMYDTNLVNNVKVGISVSSTKWDGLKTITEEYLENKAKKGYYPKDRIYPTDSNITIPMSDGNLELGGVFEAEKNENADRAGKYKFYITFVLQYL